MPPTESDILSHYLLQPGRLQAITTFDQFRTLFPRQWQSTPQVRSLFRDLQAQRNATVDAVAEGIAVEARRGAAMRREVLRQRLDAEREDPDAEIELERALFGNKSGAKSAKHTLHSVIPELEGAVGAMEAEVKQLEDEEAELMTSLRQTVGDLSDLRYGKLSNPQLPDDVMDGLASLEDACAGKT